MKTRRLLLTVVLALGLTLAVLAGMVGSLPCARADTYTVTNTNASGLGSLRQAILDTNGNLGHDIIDFGVNGTIVLTGALPAISDDLTIIGPGAEQLAVSGDNAYRVFEIVSNTAMTMTGLTVRDGQADNGGGIWSAGALHLDSVRIMSNTASGIYPDGRGGGVYVDEGSATLNMSGGQITDNSAYYGGGVGVEYGSVTLSGTQVFSNSAGWGGGGMYIYEGIAILSGTSGTPLQVLGNSASYGGGMYVDQGSATLSVSGGRIIDNSASNYGGGVYVYEGSATLSGTQVFSNSAISYGGGVYVYLSSAMLNASGGEIIDNSAYFGGGVFIDQGSATLSRTLVFSNSARWGGGGVCISMDSATLNASGGEITNNSADQGGGVYIASGSATLSGTRVLSNSAAQGGGVYVDEGSATLSGTRVFSNSAYEGGGVYVRYGSATLNVSSGEITGNSAYYEGGGVYIASGSATLTEAQVLRNSARDGDGGGVYLVSGSATLNMSGGEITGNSANSGGGGVSVEEGSVTLTGTQVLRNSAVVGGGMYVEEGSATLSGTQMLDNSAIAGGGVSVVQSSTTLYKTQVLSNSADYGGGMYVWGGSATLSGTQIFNNSARHGGGMSIEYGNVTMHETHVLSNSAYYDGGGVYLYEGSATLDRTQVFSNSADYGVGGGVCIEDGSVILSGTQVFNNSAYEGGGVYAIGGSTMLSGTQALRNSANRGGGLFIYGGDATLSGTQVFSNSAIYQGGGLYIRHSRATLDMNGGEITDNLAGQGGGVYVDNGSVTLNGTRIAANDAPDGSAVYQYAGTIIPTTALTITGNIYQAGGRFAGSHHDLRIEGSLALAGGDFYAPDVPTSTFILTGLYAHTGGAYHQIQPVNGSGDVRFPKAGGLIINANGQDLGSTEVVDAAVVDCAGVTPGEAVQHCYTITPTLTTGRAATVTFYYRSDEVPTGQDCAFMEAYRWTGTWDNVLTRDGSYGTDGRLCGSDPQSIRVSSVDTFSPFALRGPAPEISVTPASFDFGEQDVDAGPTVSQTVTIANEGLSDLHISAVTSAGDTGVFNLSDSGESTLAPGNARTIEVAFDPVSTGVKTVTLTIQSNDSDEPTVEVTLTGTGVYREITVAPLSLAFGEQDVDAGPTVSQTVTITNEGLSDLHIIAVTSAGDTGAFELSDSGESMLTPGSTRTIEVAFDPSSAGILSATLSIQSDDSDEPSVDVTFTGTGVDQEITVAPSSLAFGEQDVDAGPTVSQVVTITNGGSADLHISAVTSTGDTNAFNLIDSGESILTPGSTRTIEVAFDPISTGTKTVTLSIQSDDSDEPVVDVTFTGTGVDQEITVAPSSLAFGEQDVDAGPTDSQTVTITNGGSADLHISAVTSTGDTNAFNLIDSGESTLTPGSTRTIEGSFDPVSIGAKAVTLTIQSDDSDEPAMDVTLTGTGVDQEITVAPSNLTFGEQDVDAGPTASQMVTITNGGSADLHIIAVTSTGDTGAFNLADSGESTLTSGSTRTIEVTFDPASTGVLSANVSIQSDDSDEPAVEVTLTGTGVDQEITVTPLNLAFGEQDVDAGATASQTVTITNDGSADLHVTGIALTGDDTSAFVIESGGETVTVTANGTHTVQVAFNPASTGAKLANLSIQSGDSDEPVVDVALSGTGVDQEIKVTPLSLAFGEQDVDAGPTASQTVTIANDGSANLHISAVMSAGDTDAFNLADSGESMLTPGSARTIEVSFDPASTGTKLAILSIQSDDSDEGTVSVILIGTGTSVSSIYTLTVHKDGTGGGTVTSEPEGIACGATCQASFTEGTAVTLTATADASSTFAGWSGACTDTGTCQVTMDAAQAVAATFTLRPGQPGYGSTPAPGSTLDLGTTEVGSTVSTTLTIRETGDMTLTATPALSGPDVGDFDVSTATLTLVDGGAAQDLVIACTPSVSATRIATLTVIHNAVGSPELYALRCTGSSGYSIFLPLVLRNS